VCHDLGRYLSGLRPAVPEPNWLNEEAYEWLELIEASTLEERHRLATERSAACLRDLWAVQGLHNAHPVVAELVRAVEERDVAAFGRAYEQVSLIEQTRHDQEFRERTPIWALRGAQDALWKSVPKSA